MNDIKKYLIVIGIGLLVVLAYFQWFYDPCNRNSKGFVNISSTSHFSLVIANEGSFFKDSITSILVNHYDLEMVQVKVIPLSSLSNLKATEYSALVILHSWYTWNPPKEVSRFIKKQRGCLEKIVLLTTSSDGTYKMEEVDAITGASKIGDAALNANKIIVKVNPLLGLE